MAYRSRHLKIRLRLSLLALVVGALAVTGVAPAQQVKEQRRLISAEKIKLAALNEKNSALEARLERTRDPAYMEKLAREQLGLVRPGESAYVVLPGRQIPDPGPRPETPLGVWERFAKWFRVTFKF